MAVKADHDCLDSRREFLATDKEPYHFSDSGLRSVYLVGIKYFRCPCGREIAEIPAIKQLLSLIARDLVQKPQSLTGEEVRYLRKRLGSKQADFAKAIGMRPETMSRMENSDMAISERADKFIRLYYALKSGDPVLIEELRGAIDKLLSWKHTKKSARIVAIRRGDEWKAKRAA